MSMKLTKKLVISLVAVFPFVFASSNAAAVSFSSCSKKMQRTLISQTIASAKLVRRASGEFCDNGANGDAATAAADKYTPKFNDRITKYNDKFFDAGGSAACDDPDDVAALDEKFPVEQVSSQDVRSIILEASSGCTVPKSLD